MFQPRAESQTLVCGCMGRWLKGCLLCHKHPGASKFCRSSWWKLTSHSCLPVSAVAVLAARDRSAFRARWKCPVSRGNVKSTRRAACQGLADRLEGCLKQWAQRMAAGCKAASGSMGVRRVLLYIALGDWEEENEASVSSGCCARCCRSRQHLLLQLSRNALGNTQSQFTKSIALRAVFWMGARGHRHWAEMWKRSL